MARKITSLFLVLALLIGVLPGSVYAAQEEYIDLHDHGFTELHQHGLLCDHEEEQEYAESCDLDHDHDLEENCDILEHDDESISEMDDNIEDDTRGILLEELLQNSDSATILDNFLKDSSLSLRGGRLYNREGLQLTESELQQLELELQNIIEAGTDLTGEEIQSVTCNHTFTTHWMYLPDCYMYGRFCTSCDYIQLSHVIVSPMSRHETAIA